MRSPTGRPAELTLGSRVEIAPDVWMPRLGFGTYKAADGAEVESALAEALRAGYRGVDTASMYGNEAGVGRALAGSGIPREELFVATKVWNDEQGREGTRAAFERSLSRLGLGYVDLYLVHWPVAGMVRETWRAMEEIHASGRARAIGVCNFLEHHIDELLAVAEIPPAVDQVEFHPRLQQPRLQAHLAACGVTLQAWAPIMRGAVAGVPEIVRIARRHCRTPAQVALRWVLQLGHTAIPKSVHGERIAENADVFGFELAPEEMEVMGSLDRQERIGPHPDRFGG